MNRYPRSLAQRRQKLSDRVQRRKNMRKKLRIKPASQLQGSDSYTPMKHVEILFRDASELVEFNRVDYYNCNDYFD